MNKTEKINVLSGIWVYLFYESVEFTKAEYPRAVAQICLYILHLPILFSFINLETTTTQNNEVFYYVYLCKNFGKKATF